jgi:hypothetical protein
MKLQHYACVVSVFDEPITLSKALQKKYGFQNGKK